MDNLMQYGQRNSHSANHWHALQVGDSECHSAAIPNDTERCFGVILDIRELPPSPTETLRWQYKTEEDTELAAKRSKSQTSMTPPEDQNNSDSESEFEAKTYYVGLPSKPRLVFRTGAPYKRPTGLEAYHVPKQILPVFNNQVAEVWDEMGPQLYTYLDSIMILWTSIDVVRFAEAKKLPGPIVLWIGVKPGTLSKEDAQNAAVRLEEILNKFNITGVEVAFRESLFIQSAGPKLLNTTSSRDPTADVRGPLTPALGLPIAARRSPTIEGTGGVYISEGGENGRIFILTARHVVFPTHSRRNNELYSAKSSAPRIDVVLLGEGSLNELKKSIAESVRQYEDDIAECTLQIEEIQEKETEGVAADSRDELQTRLNSLKASLAALNSFRDEVEKQWSRPEQRIIGHVAYSPPISNDDARDFTEDWALVELDRSKIDWEKFRGNVIDLGTEIKSSKFTAMMYPDDTARTSFKYPLTDRLLLVRGIITKDKLHLPQTNDANGEPCTMVIKNGRTTGTTIGRASRIDSFTRQYFDDGTSVTSREWAILGYDKKQAFSKPGDSGAVIVDGNGQVGGLLIGGAGQTDSTDITYATPFYWLFERIKTHYPDAHLY